MSEIYKLLSDFDPKDVNWLWPGYIAYGMLNILEGDPDTGKSYLAMHLTAEMTKGGVLPDGTKLEPQSVVYCTTEDDCNYTVRPRIDAMGGDAERVIVQGEYEPFDERGLSRLKAICEKHTPGLLVLDTLYGFVPAKANVYRPNEMRQWLTGLNDLAKKSGVAILIIRHLTKMKQAKAIHQGSGTMDVIGVVRSGMLVTPHPELKNLRVVAQVKHNLAGDEKSWMYQIVEEEGCDRPVIKWQGQTELSAQDLSDASVSAGPSELERAVDFLRDQLSDGPRRSKFVERRAGQRGVSKRTLTRAIKELGVRSKRKGNGWVMSLPRK